MLSKGVNMIIMGAPGGGKGTIAKKLVKDFKFNHISTGDLLRAQISAGSKLGKEAQSYITTGSLVPDEIVIGILQEEYQKLRGTSVLLDGFPRTVNQAVQMKDVLPVHAVAFLDIAHETIIDRLSKRWVHADSGRTYAYDYNPPKIHGKDDLTGEDLTQRDDDKPLTIKKRLESFDRQTLPLFEYYETRELPIRARKFPGTKSDIIYEDMKKYFHESGLFKH
jgi:nucleoside-triphosphate--adenylate kinase